MEGRLDMMDITGSDGRCVGHVERFELDRAGRLDGIIAIDVSGTGSRAWIPVAVIAKIERGKVIVSVSAAELRALPAGWIIRQDMPAPGDVSQDQAA